MKLLSTLVVGLCVFSIGHTQTETCFIQEDVIKAAGNFRVENNTPYPASWQNKLLMLSAPPYRINGTYPDAHIRYPGNSFASWKSNRLTQQPAPIQGIDISQYINIWVNRCANVTSDSTCSNTTIFRGNYYQIDIPNPDPEAEYYHYLQDVTPGGIFAPDINNDGQKDKFEKDGIRPIFTSVKKADGCTRINVARALKLPDTYLDTIASLHDLEDRYHEAEDILEHWDDYDSVYQITENQKFHHFVDRCIVEPRNNFSPDLYKGIVLDWEVHDKRSAQETIALVNRISEIVIERKNKELILFTNSIGQAQAAHSNGIIKSNADGSFDYSALKEILVGTHKDQDQQDTGVKLINYFSPIIWSGSTPGNGGALKPRYRPNRNDGSGLLWSHGYDLIVTINKIDQALNGESGQFDYTSLLPLISLYDLDRDDALYLRNQRWYRGFAGYGIWQNFVRPGGNCNREEVVYTPNPDDPDNPIELEPTKPNQAIACIARSNCNGAFRTNL